MEGPFFLVSTGLTCLLGLLILTLAATLPPLSDLPPGSPLAVLPRTKIAIMSCSCLVLVTRFMLMKKGIIDWKQQDFDWIFLALAGPSYITWLRSLVIA